MAMSGTFHLTSDYVAGYTLSDSRRFSNSAVSRRTLTILPCSFCLDHKLRIENGRLKCVPNSSSFVCQASSGGYRRNPDFSRLNKHGFRGRNRQSEEKDDFDIENSEMMSSRNGPLLSLSSSPKFQATSSPGPREKEIVELFRKVQAQLRARAAAKKEEKKTEEASKVPGKESETVDSLLKLLRKHSGEQSKNKVNSQGEVQGDNVDKQDRSGKFVNSGNKDYNASSFTRPTSSFRRKSPVPRSKSPPAYSSEATFDQASSYSVTWTQKKDTVELRDESEHEPVEPEYEHEPEDGSEPVPVTTMVEPESELKRESSSFYQEEDDDDESLDDGATLDVFSDDGDDDESLDDADEDSDGAEEVVKVDLSKLKLMELRDIAKSRGLKGFSKMKKAELVELLGSNSS
ncbi:Rho-N domain-containing protein 1 [Cardamine amara subsp. amara]|uniref:Rho-N domain-containing protein 1 n=1 Tax=Cardamine amara subsp. amara TaxID=228776 RepID=A0ABD1A5N8_CARAN